MVGDIVSGTGKHGELVNFADPVDLEHDPGNGHRRAARRRLHWQGMGLTPRHPLGPPPLRIYWRDAFVPPAPLFRATGTPWMLATDALAEQGHARGNN